MTNLAKPKPRILFFLQNLDNGGAQRHTVNLARAMRDRFDVHILAHADDPVSAGIVGPDISPLVTVLNERGLADPAKWRKITNAIAAQKPDLIVSVNQIPSILAQMAPFLAEVRCPRVVVFHTTTLGKLSGWLRTLAFYPAAWTANALVFISSNQARLWRSRGLSNARALTIRNGIAVTTFTPPSAEEKAEAKRRLGFAPDDYVIGLSAVFRWEKNHKQAVAALKALRDQGTIARLLLLGDGEMRPEIENLATELGVTDQIHFAGMQKDVKPFLAAMDVGLLCSLAVETLSLAALECMATGVPMILSDIGGASEIVEHGTSGMLFPAGDTEALVHCLQHCAPTEVRRSMGERARERVLAHFDQGKMNQDYAALFETLIAKGQS
jgi:glycosyltransferase involved in cell wall biosynthesis